MAVLSDWGLALNDSFPFTMKRSAARIGNPKEDAEERRHARGLSKCCTVMWSDGRSRC